MKTYVLERSQELPISLDEAWSFFSTPENLKVITPDHLGFEITSNTSLEKMYSGQLISYKVKPVLGIPLNWVTEIKNVVDKNYFIDEQRFGPYKFWYHEHWFKKTENGVLMTDRVTYALPFGILGRFGNAVFVKKQLADIFDYRFKKVQELFPFNE